MGATKYFFENYSVFHDGDNFLIYQTSVFANFNDVKFCPCTLSHRLQIEVEELARETASNLANLVSVDELEAVHDFVGGTRVVEGLFAALSLARLSAGVGLEVPVFLGALVRILFANVVATLIVAILSTLTLKGLLGVLDRGASALGSISEVLHLGASLRGLNGNDEHLTREVVGDGGIIEACHCLELANNVSHLAHPTIANIHQSPFTMKFEKARANNQPPILTRS